MKASEQASSSSLISSINRWKVIKRPNRALADDKTYENLKYLQLKSCLHYMKLIDETLKNTFLEHISLPVKSIIDFFQDHDKSSVFYELPVAVLSIDNYSILDRVEVAQAVKTRMMELTPKIAISIIGMSSSTVSKFDEKKTMMKITRDFILFEKDAELRQEFLHQLSTKAKTLPKIYHTLYNWASKTKSLSSISVIIEGEVPEQFFASFALLRTYDGIPLSLVILESVKFLFSDLKRRNDLAVSVKEFDTKHKLDSIYGSFISNLFTPSNAHYAPLPMIFHHGIFTFIKYLFHSQKSIAEIAKAFKKILQLHFHRKESALTSIFISPYQIQNDDYFKKQIKLLLMDKHHQNRIFNNVEASFFFKQSVYIALSRQLYFFLGVQLLSTVISAFSITIKNYSSLIEAFLDDSSTSLMSFITDCEATISDASVQNYVNFLLSCSTLLDLLKETFEHMFHNDINSLLQEKQGKFPSKFMEKLDEIQEFYFENVVFVNSILRSDNKDTNELIPFMNKISNFTFHIILKCRHFFHNEYRLENETNTEMIILFIAKLTFIYNKDYLNKFFLSNSHKEFISTFPKSSSDINILVQILLEKNKKLPVNKLFEEYHNKLSKNISRMEWTKQQVSNTFSKALVELRIAGIIYLNHKDEVELDIQAWFKKF